MIYEYANAAGERREIVASMKEPPPEILCSADGRLFADNGVTEEQCRAYLEYGGDPAAIFRRVYTAGQPPIVKKYGVEYAGQALPVSRALPLDLTPGTVENRGGHTVLKHADGGYTDLKGRRIVANKQDVERAEVSTGMKRD